MTQRRYRAILIGTSEYPLDPHNLPSLDDAPLNDLRVLGVALTAPHAPVLASLIGVDITTPLHWSQRAQRDWSVYLAVRNKERGKCSGYLPSSS